MNNPLISVVIPTFNRAELLRASLESLACQCLGRDRFEVVVVDDGSTDTTSDVCRDLAKRMHLRYFHIEHSGISAAKNLGIFAASAPILLFFDDDDYAAPTLLREHLIAHQQYPEEWIAVLGYTTWAPSLPVTEVMHYVMDVGRLLFCYTMNDGQTLDFTFFWGGRSSCKREFLARHGIFRHELRSILEDIELGYRLSKHGLQVVFHRQAQQYMNRAITYDEFCRRCERQGASQFQFSRLHSGPLIQRYCQVADAPERWERIQKTLGMQFYKVREIEAQLDRKPYPANDMELREVLHDLYRRTFDGFKTKGFVEALNKTASAAAPAPVVEPIVIYQMGKVGSKTIEKSLRAIDLGAPLCHSHLLHNLDCIEKDVRHKRSNTIETLTEIQHGRELRKTILGTPNIRCRVISLVRDPVARNISAFFQNITEFFPDFVARYTEQKLPLEELHTTFLNRYDHNIPLTWFQLQLEPVFGIDVFASEFPKERGYAVYHSKNASLLVLKLEMLDKCAADAMGNFLGIHNFVLSNENVGQEKEYKDAYNAFLQSIVLSDDYLNCMYDNAFARHFYTGIELQRFRERWMARKSWQTNTQHHVVSLSPTDVNASISG